MPDTSLGFKIIKDVVRQRHLDQLSAHPKLYAEPLKTMPVFATREDIVQWSEESKAQIAQGQADRVYGGPIGSPLNLNNAFMAFMESATVYLRDTSKVLDAVQKYQAGHVEEALRLLEDSTRIIDEIAEMWGMEFVQICDLPERHPDGHSFLVGPYCGAFFPKDFSGHNPFIGIAYKGTSNFGEFLNDLLAASTIKASGRLWNTEVCSGFYYPLFSTYSAKTLTTTAAVTSTMPFVMVQQAVQDLITRATTTVITHVTGHSLGGAYATLTHGQLCIEGFGAAGAAVGDLYTFGGPRAGRGDFATLFKASVAPPTDQGSTWRIVNYKDYIPKVPASKPLIPVSNPFVHIDAGVMVYPDKQPESLPSEIGTKPTWSIPTAISPHYTTEYYKSLVFATTGKPPVSATLARAPHSPSLSTYNTTQVTAKLEPETRNALPGAEVTFEPGHGGFVVGKVRYGHFLGEIVALGTLSEVSQNPQFFCDSMEALYGKENHAVFSVKDGKTLEVRFIVDDQEVAVARASTSEDIDQVPTRGVCRWTFYDDGTLEAVEQSVAQSAAAVFQHASA
ncbi:hypothetical protein CC2G_014588 [Coprinopsis cinerea AmutBmut pab1-1]|nr:hypothetical protein CC2G_014588 [Coprinopsis cinerea AmutBmut pab1-1]